jgi:hypothetical protein
MADDDIKVTTILHTKIKQSHRDTTQKPSRLPPGTGSHRMGFHRLGLSDGHAQSHQDGEKGGTKKGTGHNHEVHMPTILHAWLDLIGPID